MNKNPYTNQENIAYKDMKFPISSFYATLHDHNSLDIHWHNDLELIQVLSGTATYIINGYTYHIKAGDVVIINPTQVHQAFVTSDEAVHNKVIQLNYNLLKTQMMDSVTENYILPLVRSKYIFSNVVESNSLKRMVNELYTVHQEKREFFEIDSKILILNIISYLFKNDLFYHNKAYQRKRLENHDYVRMASAYIQKNYKSNISLDDISSHCNVSKFHLCNIFKDNTNTTITHYIIGYRLSKAKELLTDTKKNINTISFDVGFNSPSYFIKTFKTAEGKTPSQYRKETQKATHS
jgi:AraC-like DNA-binding protein/mannose-6-phosphate isomerase-like protein (cupin superfamily)